MADKTCGGIEFTDSVGRDCGAVATHTCEDGYGTWYYCDEHSASCCAVGVEKEET